MNQYKSIDGAIKDYKSDTTQIIFTGFRPSYPTTGNPEDVDFTLGHTLQARNLKRLQEATGADIYCIIANSQSYTDIPKKSHMENIGKITPIYTKSAYELMSAMGLNMDKVHIFLESDVLKETAFLTHHLMSNVYLDDFKEKRSLGFTSFQALDDYYKKIKYDNNLGKIFTNAISQSAQIIGLQGTLIPSGRDQLESTYMAKEFVTRINDRLSLTLSAPEAICHDIDLYGNDNQIMSTSRGNFISLKHSNEEIEKFIEGLNDKRVKEYISLFCLQVSDGKDGIYKFLKELKYNKESQSRINLGGVLEKGKEIVNKRISKINNLITQSIY